MDLRSATRALTGTLDGIDTCIAWSEDEACCGASVRAVSHWSVRAHVEHLMLSDTTIVRVLEQIGDGTWPDTERGKPKLIGRIIQWTGRIPRGRGRAPERVIPGDMSEQEIASGLRNVRSRFERLSDLLAVLVRSRATREHPALGHFTASQWLRFVHVHHEHHHRIIRDILRA